MKRGFQHVSLKTVWKCKCRSIALVSVLFSLPVILAIGSFRGGLMYFSAIVVSLLTPPTPRPFEGGSVILL